MQERADGAAVVTEFGQLVLRHRQAAGLTQEQLADRAGLSVRGVRYLERGERVPYPDTANRLAAAFGLPQHSRRALSLAAAAARGRVAEGLVPERLPNADDVIGRSDDIEAIAALLRDRAPIVSLTGPAGVGKTTVAAATGRHVDSEYAGGVRWASLAAVDDAGGLLQPIWRALGLPASSPPNSLAQMAAHLADDPWLVVLDNMEQVTDAAAVIAELVERCRGLQLLVTSRRALRVRREHEYRLAPLGVPSGADGADLAVVLQSPAVRVFLRRARSVDYRFDVTEDNAAAVSAICRRLDGLPLALELAAARVRVFDPGEIVSHLDRPLDLLTNGPADAPDRQRSLRAAIGWSHALLTASEQRLFRRLGVFVDGASLDAIAAVCAEPPGRGLVDDLDALVRSSLVLKDVALGASRYRLLETIRHHAAEQLAAHRTEQDDVRARHSKYFAQVAADTGSMIEGPQQAEVMARLDSDRSNIRAAIARLTSDGPAADGLRAMTATWMYFYIRGYADEGRRQLAALLAVPDPTVSTELRAAALLAMSQLARVQGDLTAAAGLAAESVALCRRTGDTAGLARALFGAGFIARVRRAEGDGRRLLTDALAVARAINDTYIVAAALHHLALLELDATGDRRKARRLLQESLTTYREMGFPRMIGIVLAALGNVESSAGRPEEAERYFTESVRVLIDAGEPREIHFPLEGLADLAYAAGRTERAVTLASAAATYRSSLRGRSIGPVLAGSGTWLDDARALLSARDFSTAWDAGEALSPHDAIAEATTAGGHRGR